MAGRAIQGVGSAASWIAALALVSDLAPPGRRGEALGIALAATGAGSIAGPALGGVATAIVLAGAATLGLVEVVAPLDLDARLGLSSSVIGLLFAGSIAVDALLAPFGGRWGDRRGRRGPAASGLVAMAVSAVLLAVLAGG